jgi:hypothetical protein
VAFAFDVSTVDERGRAACTVTRHDRERPMRKWNTVRAVILILPALAIGAASARASSRGAKDAKETTEPAVESQAKDALTRMGEYYKSLGAYALHEDITHEQVIDNDLKVQKHSTVDSTVRQPDRLKAVVVADDDKSHTLYFDGKTFTAFFGGKNYYAQMDAPGTTAAALDRAQADYGVELPMANFLDSAAKGELTKELTAAGFVGSSRVGGADADHYAYRTADVDFQVWIASGAKPLPLKVVITSKKMPAQPEHSVVMTWDTAPKIEDALFAFTPPEGATKIPFGTPPGAVGKKTPAKPQQQE